MTHSDEIDAPYFCGLHDAGVLGAHCECPALVPDSCIAPPGNLCLDTGCWDMDRCITPPAETEGGAA